MGFLPFTPRASPTIFGLLWASFQDYPPTHWLPLPLLSTCLLQRYSFHDKIPFCLFLLYTSTSKWLNKDWAISLPSSMACINRPFFLFPYFFLHYSPSVPPFFLPWLPSFYSKLIQWDFFLLLLGLHQLFLVCCGHPFKITHSPIGCPYHCLVHVCCNATHFTTKFPFVCSCCIPLPLGD